MKKPFVPDINLYSSITPFLVSFYNLNKEKNPKFSYRFLALKLGWSAPYLNDVFKGRKKLSLNRALEFIDFLRLTGARAERFLFLFLADTDHAFAHSHLKDEVLITRNSQQEKPKEDLMDLKDFERLYLLDYYIMYFIELYSGKWNTQLFIDKLNLAEKPSVEMVERHLDHLIHDGYLAYDKEKDSYRHLPDPLKQKIFDQSPSDASEEEKKRFKVIQEHEREYALNYLSSIPSENHARVFYSGIISLDTETFYEAQDRISSLRNYLYELDIKTYKKYLDTPNRPKDLSHQFSMNMFSLFKKDAFRSRAELALEE